MLKEEQDRCSNILTEGDYSCVIDLGLKAEDLIRRKLTTTSDIGKYTSGPVGFINSHLSAYDT